MVRPALSAAGWETGSERLGKGKREMVKSEDEQAEMSGGLLVRVYDRMECSYPALLAP